MTSIGPLSVDVRGDSIIAELVREELGVSSQSQGNSQISIEITESTRRHAVPGESNMRVRGSRAPYRFGATSSDEALQLSLGLKGTSRDLYSVEVTGDLLSDKTVGVSIAIPSLRHWAIALDPLVRVFGRDSSSVAEIAAKNIIYEIIDPLMWVRLMSSGATFVHASSVAAGGEAVMFSGTGGVGKSTSLLSIMESSDRFTYLADDLVIVDSTGTLWRHPKHLQVYEYNLRSSPSARLAVFERLGPVERLLWRARARLLGPSRVRKRLSATDLFGRGRVADSATLFAVAWLTPARTKQGWAGVHPQLIVERGVAAILEEFWDFLRLVNLGSGVDPRAPSVALLAEKAAAILDTVLAGVPCFELGLAMSTDGDSAGAMLERFLDEIGL
jgi:hypothetical protein